MQAIRVAPRAGNSSRYKVEAPTDVGMVGEVVEAVLGCCRSVADTSQTVRFRICTCVAEAIANAMLYGNSGDRSREVVIDVELEPDVIRISVTDEGNGFDYQRYTHAPVQPPQATGGRGLFLIHHLADAVNFNDKGNSICMMLRRS